MTRTLSRTPLIAAAAFAVMLALLVVLMGAGGDPVASSAASFLAATPDAPRPRAPPHKRSAAPGSYRPGVLTHQHFAVLQATVSSVPKRAGGYALLAVAYRQKVLETG